MTKTFFLCTLQDVKQKGVPVTDALVVTRIRTGNNPIDNELEVSEKNRSVLILGKRYIPELDTFEEIDDEI